MPKMGDELDCWHRRWEMPGFEIVGIQSWGIASVGLLRSQVVTEPPTNPRAPATRCLEVCGTMTSSCATLWLAGTGTEIRTTGRARTPLECFRQRTTSLFPSQQANSRRPSCECRLPDPRAEMRQWTTRSTNRLRESRAPRRKIVNAQRAKATTRTTMGSGPQSLLATVAPGRRWRVGCRHSDSQNLRSAGTVVSRRRRAGVRCLVSLKLLG